MSKRELSRRANFDRGYIDRVMKGEQRPSTALAKRLDTVLGAEGMLVSLATNVSPPVPDDEEYTGELVEAMRLIETSTIGAGTLEVLHGAVERLCRDYPTVPGPMLRDRSQRLMRKVIGLLDQRSTLAEHRELLVIAGWLAALLGCVLYDVGDRPAAEAARRLTFQLGAQAGHGELVGWSFEMAAWFALTEGRYPDVVEAAEAGLRHAGVSSAGVQLALQEAKARARMGDDRTHNAVKAGRSMLDQLPTPEHPENHFVFDPAKYEFYAATIYTMLGWDKAAEEHSKEVMRQCLSSVPVRWPMRLSETRIDLGIVAGRRGDLDEAVHLGVSAFEFERRAGSLVSRAGDLLSELEVRYPAESLVKDYRDRIAEEQNP